jgi:polysaccharide export outer membrane protein
MSNPTRLKQQTILPFCGLALGLAFCTAASAQETMIAPPVNTMQDTIAPPMTATAASPYLLAGDDEISIKVVNFPDLSIEKAVVTPDGIISVPLIGTLNVTGQTTAQVAETLTSRWSKYVINPSVSVSLMQKREQDVLFYGSVTKAGTTPYRPGMHLLSALAETGGSLPTGDLGNVTVSHPNGQNQALDLSHPEIKAGTSADIVLQPGDVVYIPERTQQVSILGEVTTPGSYDYKDDMTVLEALKAAGGVKPDTADLANSSLVHQGKESPLDLDALLNKGDLALNTKLASGDRILIPEIHDRTYVFGSVTHPGYYSFKAGDRILDALNPSGPLPDADLSKINLIRVDKTKNTSQISRVDIQKFLSVGDLTGNVLLQPNDVLYIPNKHKTVSLPDVMSLVTGLGVLRVL